MRHFGQCLIGLYTSSGCVRRFGIRACGIFLHEHKSEPKVAAVQQTHPTDKQQATSNKTNVMVSSNMSEGWHSNWVCNVVAIGRVSAQLKLVEIFLKSGKEETDIASNCPKRINMQWSNKLSATKWKFHWHLCAFSFIGLIFLIPHTMGYTREIVNDKPPLNERRK